MSQRVEQIRNHALFQQELQHIIELEAERKFCRHGWQHLLDVARIGYALILEQELPIDKEIMYAAALLHDIGKGIQYEEGIPHQIAGLPIAEQILKETGFSAEQTARILEAIESHRKPVESENPLVDVLYQADKKARPCYYCESKAECNWPDWKRTNEIEY